MLQGVSLFFKSRYFRRLFKITNQTRQLSQFYSVIKLHVSGIFSAHRWEFSTVRSALVSFMQAYDDHFQAESGWTDSAWKRSSETFMKLTSAECTVENSFLRFAILVV